MGSMFTDRCSASMYGSANVVTMAQSRSQKSLPRCYAWMPLLPFVVMTCSCANPYAVLNFAAPTTATAGTPFTVTVTATIQGQRDTIINSVIRFTSSDPLAVLPPDYGFTAADTGSHTWTNGFILNTPGRQTISATMFDASGINGSASVAVSQ